MSSTQSSKSSVLKPLAMSQTISFQDSADGSSFDVHAKEVIVRSSAGSHTSGSSKVKLKSIVDYGWESRHYPGRLVAIHMEGKYLAYGLKPVGKSIGVVRVVNRETEERVLIRDLLGLVQDLCFAHIRSQIMLASVDHFGNLFVHQIQLGATENLECSLFLHVEYEGGQSAVSLTHHVVWCPYIPEDGGQASVDDDAAKLLVVTHGAKAEMLNVARVRADIPMGEVRVRPSHVLEGRLPMEEHSGDIVEASFSPDGTALATASADGLVKFFQVYLPTESKPRCLHKWRPHGGRPLSCLFFLDDHRNHSPEVQFWKYAITGTRNNHELKLWSCESWTCLQTIYFGEKEAPRNQEEGFLKAGLDLAAKFLILSDIGRKVLYVLQFGRDEDEGISFVSTISEFHLPYPILSFGVVDAEISPSKCASGSPTASYADDPSGVEAEGEEGKGDGEESIGRRRQIVVEGEEAGEVEASLDGMNTVVIHIVLVQPKSLQECHIVFEAGSTNSTYQPESTSHPLPVLMASDCGEPGNPVVVENQPMEMQVEVKEDTSLLTHAVSVGSTTQMAMESTPDGIAGAVPNPIPFSNVANAPILTLMTPDAFSSPIRREGVTPASGHAGSHPTSLVSSPASTLSAPSSSGAQDKATPPSAPSPHPAESRFPPPPPLDHSGPHSPGPVVSLSQNHPPHMVQTSHAFVPSAKVGGESGLSPHPQVSSVDTKVEEEGLGSVGAGNGDRTAGVVGGSGGSSPSREVRQILSLSDSPRGVEREFFDEKEAEEEEGVIVMGQTEEEEDEEEEAVEALVREKIEAVVLVNQPEVDIRNTQVVAGSASNHPEGLNGQPPPLESLPVGNLAIDSAIVAEKTSGEASVRQNGDESNVGVEGRIGAGLAALAVEVGSLARAVRAQGESLQRLRSEVKAELAAVRSESRWSVEGAAALGSMLEASLRPHLERSLDQSVRSAMDRVGPVVEGTLEEHCRELRVEHQKFCREGPSGVCWDSLVHSAVSSGLEPLRVKLASEAAAQAENAAREGVALALQRNSKMLVDSLAGNLLVTLRPAMLETFRNALSAVVLPSFEKSCSHMFQQINDAFSHGTKEYGRVLEAHFERRWNAEKSKEATAMETIRTEARQLADAIREDVPAQIRQMSSGLGESLAREVRSALEEPLARRMHEQREWMEGSLTKSLQSIMFSPANIPPMTPDASKRLVPSSSSPLPVSPNGALLMRTRISELLAQGRVNEAFQMALSASDLGLVTYLCELTSPAQVFGGSSVMGGGGKCKLEQPVLLSLVQQLSANLFDRTELKMSYLGDAVFHLDMRQPDLREHLVMVLGVLQKGLNAYVLTNPGSKLTKEMRMLLMTSACMMEFAKSHQMPATVGAGGYGFRDQSSVSLMD